MRTARGDPPGRPAARTDADLFGGDDPAAALPRAGPALHPDRLPADRRYAPRPPTAFVRTSPPGGPGAARAAPSPATTGSARSALAGDLADLYDVGAERLLKLPARPGRQRPAWPARRTPCGTIARARRPALPAVRAPAGRRRSGTGTPPSGAERRVNVLAAATRAARASPRSGARTRRARRRGTRPGCGGGCWSRSAWPTGPGVVHGAVLPRARADRTRTTHGLVLVDWCYSRRRARRARPGAGRPATATGTRRRSCPSGPPAPAPTSGDGHPLHEPADGRPRAPRRCARFAAAAARSPRPPTRRRLAAAAANSTSCCDRLYGPRTFRPFTLQRPKENCHGQRNLVHRRLRRRRRATARPPAPARSPTATAARAPCTPRSTRTASTSGRAATPTSTRDSLAIAVLFDVTGSMGARAARPADQAAAAARPAAAQGLRRATRRSCSARSATPPATGCRCRSASSSRTTGWTTTSAGSCWRAAAAGR